MTKETDNFDNIQFIQHINRMVLKEAEKAITTELPGDGIVPKIVQYDKEGNAIVDSPTPEELETESKKRIIVKRRWRMWGKDNPIVWMLEKIADTELKIAKQRPASIEPPKPPPLSDREQELLEGILEADELL